MDGEWQQALTAYQHGDWLKATRICRQIISHRPDSVDALHLLGVIAARSGEPADAVHWLRRAADIRGTDPVLLVNLGNACSETGDFMQARDSYARALSQDPGHVSAHLGLGHVYSELGQFDAAEAHYKAALANGPDNADAHYNYANLLADRQRPEAALDHYSKAIALRPDFVAAYNNCGMLLSDLGRHDEAIAIYRRAIAIDPLFSDLHNHLGITLAAAGRYADAVTAYRQALSITPGDVDANWNLALCQLVLGDFANGWAGFEWRWKHPSFRKYRKDFPQPRWDGKQDLRGKTLLLHAEQGLGDTLQFCRYASLLPAESRVILETQAPLTGLLSGLSGVAGVYPTGGQLPAFDCHCPIMSLPYLFGTVLETIPADVPYLRSSPQASMQWRSRLGRKTKPRIGIVWSGNPSQSNDRNRSMPFSQLLPMLDPAVEWISLQKDLRDSDAGLLGTREEVRHFGTALEDFQDTAGLIDNLDLVISVCTSVAHLAGAMGKPLWILLPYDADWRWLVGRADSPWYPSARLFRQQTIGDWPGVIAGVRAALQPFIASHVPSSP